MEKAKKLQQLIEDSGYSVNKVAKLAGIPQSTLATMLKNGVGKAGIDGVASVCAVLGITLDDLIKSCSLDEALEHWKPTQQEQILVKKYRQLPETGKQAVESMMDTMLAAQPKQAEEGPIIREVYRMAKSVDDRAPTIEKRDITKFRNAPKVTREEDI